MKKKEYPDDDGRTIADMSGLERRPLFPRKGEKNPPANGMTENKMSRGERGAYILGAVSAVLAVSLAFIVGIGLTILILYLVWNA